VDLISYQIMEIKISTKSLQKSKVKGKKIEKFAWATKLEVLGPYLDH
jgi:hypothetical protein